MASQVDLGQWRPTKIVEAASRGTMAEFVEGLGTAALLLVKVDNFNSKVARGLSGISEHPPAPASVAASMLTSRANTKLIVARIEEARKLHGSRRRSLLTLMLEPRYLVPIRQRGTPDRRRPALISVGRSRDQDVVLRDPSVSKIHALFRRDAQGLYLCDSSSRNGTFVNGVVTTEHEVPVEHGDEVRFGELETLICGTENLWQLIHGL